MTDAKNGKASRAASADPSKIDKKEFHPKADALNFVALTGKGKPFLACGATSKNKKTGNLCHATAGMGTEHVGYGRCKFHGGSSTGPKTPEGKAKSSQNGRIHGLYSRVLMPGEAAIFDDLVAGGSEALGLKFEILTMKAKIIAYLAKWSTRWQEVAAKEGQDVADLKTRVYFNEGDNGKARNHYHAGTIEDRTLDRALNTLRRLVDAYAKMNGDQGDDLVSQLNAELRAASFGQVSLSWGGKPQGRTEGGGENDD